MRQKVASGTFDSHRTADSNTAPNGPAGSRESNSLREILPNAQFHSGDDIEFHSLCEASALAMPSDLVVYRIGKTDPVRVVAEAMACGAAGILTEQLLPCPLPQCVVGDVEQAVATIVSHSGNQPDQKLLTIGVVGSAGKTTSALLISTLLRAENIPVAYQTDLGCCDGMVQSTDRMGVPAGADLVRWMSDAVDCESQVGIVELDDQQARHGGYDSIEFDMVVITGSTDANEDFGPSALTCVLDRIKPDGVVIAPADDRRAMRLIQDAGVPTVTYGVRREADITAKLIEQEDGVSTLLVTHENTTTVLETSLCGGAMAANHAAATAVGLLLDIALPTIVDRLGTLRKIPGRGQRLSRFGHAVVMIDAAGTPERCAASLRMARSMKSGGRLWCIAAIGPDHDAQQLARLGNLLERFADHAVITSIPGQQSGFLAASHQVLDGVEKCAAMRLVANQQRAIRWAMEEAKSNDTILILTNQNQKSSYDERKQFNDLEKWVESTWDQSEASHPTPQLKVFG